MNLNGQNVLVTVHETKDAQEIKSYLESIDEEIVNVDVTPYTIQENSVKYLVVVYTKILV